MKLIHTTTTHELLYIVINIKTIKKGKKKIGNYLFSLTLSSALKCLTSVFEMGTGVSTLLSLPIKYREIIL